MRALIQRSPVRAREEQSMFRFMRMVVAVVSAATMMAIAAAGASAYDMSVSPAGSFTATAATLTFSDGGGVINVACPVTLSGSLSAGSITMAAGNSVGSISGVSVGSCTGGSATALVGTSYDMRINTILGTLPNAATGLLFDVLGFSFEYTVRILTIQIRCLYSGTIGVLFGLSGTNPYTLSNSGVFLGNSVPKAAGHSACPSSGRFNGTMFISPGQTISVS